ncbi:MAG: hypothetical protein ABR578_07300, partial [Chromatocurvus sp.]
MPINIPTPANTPFCHLRHLYHLRRLAALTLLWSASGLAAASAVNDAVEEHLASRGAQMLTEFRELLSLPNVSTSTADMQENAEWISAYIDRRGFKSRIVSAGGAPYIIAERPAPGATKTVLIYAHYDGQPVEPANWKTPPFVPTLKAAGDTIDWSRLATERIDP